MRGLLLGLLLLLGALGQRLSGFTPAIGRNYVTISAICVLEPTTGSTLQGSFLLRPPAGDTEYEMVGEDSIEVVYNLTGMTGNFVAHIRRFGQILSPDGTSNGPVFFNLSRGAVLSSGSGSFIEPSLSLGGSQDAVVGRAITVSRPGQENRPLAQCVIGVQEDEILDATAVHAQVRKASCVVRGTRNYPQVSGYIDFEVWPDGVHVRTFVRGFPTAANHTWHVHEYGDISDPLGARTGPHFGLNCGCRSRGLNETGAIGDSSFLVANARGIISDYVLDNVLSLDDLNSIIGRGIIIHDSTRNAARAAQCVIGISRVDDFIVPAPPTRPAVNPVTGVPTVMRGNVILRETATARRKYGSAVDGYVDIQLQPQGELQFSYFISGLKPNAPYSWLIYEYGDVMGDSRDSDTALAFSGIFTGSTGTSTPAGQINNGVGLRSNSLGVIEGEALDFVLEMNGVNSIIGRSLVILDPDTNEIVAAGVVARVVEDLTTLREGNVVVSQAVCRMQPLLSARTDAPAGFIDGFVLFELNETALNIGGRNLISVRTFIAGLRPSSSFPWHVHANGDIIDIDAGQGVGPHFIGNPTTRDEVGQLDANMPIWSDEYGISASSFDDAEVRLNGFHSIIGRGMIIHGSRENGRGSVRIAQCVIGITRESRFVHRTLSPEESVGSAPLVIKAQATLTPVHTFSNNRLRGYVEFTRDNELNPQFPEHANGLIVRYMISGLTPGQHNWTLQAYGDELSPDVSSKQTFITTASNLQGEYNTLGDGFTLLANENGVASGVFFDNDLELNGEKSIIGRGLAIRGSPTNPLDVVGFGVIGRVLESNETAAAHAPDFRAGCFFNATHNITGTGQGARRVNNEPILGWVRFSAVTSLRSSGNNGALVEYQIAGLEPRTVYSWDVHSLGDRLDNDGLGSLDLYRGIGSEEPVGEIGNFTADENGISTGFFFDPRIRLNGANSVLGRSVLIHKEDSESPLAHCVVGFVKPEPVIFGSPRPVDSPRTTKGVCVVETFMNEETEGLSISGTIDLTRTEVGITVQYNVAGLPASSNLPWSVSTFGTLFDRSGSALTPVFNFTVDREMGPDVVGSIADAVPLMSNAEGVASGNFVDRFIALNGARSIIGRAIVIYRSPESTLPIAGCIVGVSEISTTDRSLEFSEARVLAILQPNPSLGTYSNITGFVEIERESGGAIVRVVSSGCPPGQPIQVQVRSTGNILSPGDLFVGDCNNCRPSGSPQAAGLVANGKILTADRNGYVATTLEDSVLDTVGADSVSGRTVVLVDMTSGSIIAAGVFGLTENRALPDPANPNGGDDGTSIQGFPGYAIVLIVIGVLSLIGLALWVQGYRKGLDGDVRQRLLDEPTELVTTGTGKSKGRKL